VDVTSCGHTLTIQDIYAGDYADEVPIRERFWQVAAGDVVLDIGASLGIYTLPALACGAAVYAVDVLDDPEICPLVQMARENGLTEHLTVIQAAVGDVDGYPAELMTAVRADPQTYPGLASGCEWTTVDKITAEYQIGRVDWIKIDTEGGELPIIRGATATLERDHPRLLIEEHSHIEHVRNWGNAPKLRDLLTGLGYSIEEVPYANRVLWFCTWPVTDAAQ
jgi:FkbM family methyltransferase